MSSFFSKLVWSLLVRKNARYFLLIGLTCLTCACGKVAPIHTELKTDLGQQGNSLVSEFYHSYKNQHAEHCPLPRGDKPRLLITGFGPFRGRAENLSGDLILNWNSSDPSANHWGVNAFTGTWEAPEGEVDVCFLYLSVIWDLAAAIVHEEALNFKPDLILSMGEGRKRELRLETVAKNTGLPG